MIDIHTHILPGCDDGSQSMEQSVLMAEIASESGVEIMVATPHHSEKGRFYNPVSDRLNELHGELCREIAENGLPVRVVMGSEVFISKSVPDALDAGRIYTLGGSRYVLTECAFDDSPGYVHERISELTKRGYVPVIAHPERYAFIQEFPEIASELAGMGCALQINRGSFFGDFGREAKRTAYLLLEHRLIHVVASDAHRHNVRTPAMSEVRSLLKSLVSADEAELLLNTNPKLMLQDKKILSFEPVPFE